MKISTLIFLLFAPAALIFAQDKEQVARQRYLEAEDAYLRSHYKDALARAQQAEQSLGRKTPKIQLLKVLVYEKLVMSNIDYYDAAMQAIDHYLHMEGQLPPLHGKYLSVVRAIQKQLPMQKRLMEQQKWYSQANQGRPGVLLSVPGKYAVGFDYGITIGKRSSFWSFQTSQHAGKFLRLDKEYYFDVTGRLEDLPFNTKIKRTFISIGYFQGIRILPQARDFVKPFVGLRVIHGGSYFLSYQARQEGYPAPEEKVINNFKANGVDPGVHYLAVTNFTEGVYFDVVAGLMFHYKRLALTAGKDFASSKMTHFGLSVRLY